MADEPKPELRVLPGGRPTKVSVEPTTVPCVRCGELIDLDARRCRHCGVYFDGAAFQFAPKEISHSPRRFLPWVVAFVVFLVVVVWLAVRLP